MLLMAISLGWEPGGQALGRSHPLQVQTHVPYLALRLYNGVIDSHEMPGQNENGTLKELKATLFYGLISPRLLSIRCLLLIILTATKTFVIITVLRYY
jgi:hypothetical protein